MISPNTVEKNTEQILAMQDTTVGISKDSNRKISELLENSMLDPRDIEKYIQELPLNNGINEVKNVIVEWYNNKRINLKEKEILLVITETIFKQNEKLSEEIDSLKLHGKNEIAQILEKIQISFTNKDASGIKNIYFERKEKLRQETITILKQSINSTEALFAYKETQDLFQELLKLDPSAQNYFAFAFFSETYNFLEDAEKYYKEALKIYRELAKENPRTHLPDVATTLNNLAVLHSIKNEFPRALEEYDEALKIRRELAKENPRTYLPDLASTLNSMAVLHSNKNEFPQALEEYDEALKIRRELAKENPRTHLPDVATTLNNLATFHYIKNEFTRALEEYNEALKIRRELAKENPRTYLPDLALTLNNLGVLHTDKNEFTRALEEYNEALKIRRELAKENPRTYLPDVAKTLSNLAMVNSYKNEFPQALVEYNEALKIYRELAKENPEPFDIEYSRMLIMGVDLFGKEKEDLKEARRILEQYPNVYRAQKLLKEIKDM